MHTLPAFHAFHVANPLAALLLGAVLLVLGRRLFWLFVGIVGFVTVYDWSLGAFAHQPEGMRLVLAVIAGIVGILLAIFAQKVGVAIAGFLVGAGLAASLLGVTMNHLGGGSAIIVLLAGIAAAVLALVLFDFALILLSSLAGAGLVLDGLALGGSLRPLLFLVLAAVGVLIQMGLLRRSRARA